MGRRYLRYDFLNVEVSGLVFFDVGDVVYVYDVYYYRRYVFFGFGC